MQLNTFLSLLTFSCLAIVAQTGSIEAASRILGGSDAEPGQFLYNVGVIINGSEDCGGSIISENYVVTAAHCLFRKDTNGQYQRYPVELLGITPGNFYREAVGRALRINDVKIHDAYDPYNIAHGSDIALLKLSEPLTFSDSIKSIKLAKKIPPKGASITISGWGATDFLKPSCPFKLQFNNNMKANPDIKAKILYLNHSEDNGAWLDDSGSPAVYENELVGVCSFVVPLNKKQYGTAPNVYTLVPAFYEWLYSNSDLRN